MNDNSIRLLFGNAEPETFTNRAKLAQELERVCNDGIAFMHVQSGRVLTRPEIKIFGSCQVYIKHISASGKINYYNYLFEEVAYEKLSFSKSS